MTCVLLLLFASGTTFDQWIVVFLFMVVVLWLVGAKTKQISIHSSFQLCIMAVLNVLDRRKVVSCGDFTVRIRGIWFIHELDNSTFLSPWKLGSSN